MSTTRIWSRICLIGLVTSLTGLSAPASAQSGATFEVPPANAPLSAADLETLVGPIALYADDLVGIVLPASTYPLQIVQASRFLDSLESDPNLQPDPNWDDSVVALLNYPEVLRMLDTNIEWTWALGAAVLDQQAGVMDAVQAFRRQAMLAGNLSSDSQQSVTQNGNLIEIAPADPEVIYIPYYEPERVVVVQPAPVIHYYADPYPLYYYPYPYGYRFRTGFFWGVTTAFHIGWHSHALNVFHHHHHLHPFYGRSYYTPFYARRGVNININLNRANPVWQPRLRRAARPHRITTGTRVTVTREGTRNSPTRTRTETVTRSPTRVNSSGTRTSTRTNRNVQRNTTITGNQNAGRVETRRQSANSATSARTNAQRVTQPQRSNRAVVQPQRANRAVAQPPRSNQQRADTRPANPRPTNTLSPAPRSSNRAGVAPSRTRSAPTFAAPQRSSPSVTRAPVTQQRSQAPVRQRSAAPSVSRAPRSAPVAGAPRSSSRQSGNAGRSPARTGASTQNGRTRR